MTAQPTQGSGAESPSIRGPAIVAVVFLAIAVSLLFVLSEDVDDEGYLTFLLSRIVGQEPIAGLFFLKTRPLISSLYALPASLGWPSFLVAHVVVSALGILFIGAAVERMGGRGGLAAMVFALSPVYLHGAVAGYANNDGLAVVALCLFLGTYVVKWTRVLLGAMLAFGFLSRFEFAPVLAGLLLHAAVLRRDALVVGTAFVAGLSYLLAGAIYHHDLLWPLTFPPAFTEPPEYHASFFASQRLAPAYLGLVATRLVAVTPLWLLPLALRWREVPSPVQWFLAASFPSFIMVLLFPAFGGVFWFPHLARHFLVLLPCAALAAAFPQALSAPGQRRLLWVLLAIPVAMTPWWRAKVALAGWAFAAPLLAGAYRSPARRPLAFILVIVLVSSSIAAFFVETLRGHHLVETRQAIGYVETTVPPSTRIFTNIKGLDLGLKARGHRADVRFLPNHSILYELQDLTNPKNGQRLRVVRAIEGILYGRALWPCRLPDEGPRAGDLLLWLPDDRLDVLFPMRQWIDQSDRLWAFGSIEARRFRKDPERTPPRDGLAAHVADYPCRSW